MRFPIEWTVLLWLWLRCRLVSCAPKPPEALVLTTTMSNVLDVPSVSAVTAQPETRRARSSKPLKPEIYSFRVHSQIQYRYSTTFVTSRVANPDPKNAHETTFRLVLPETAFISKFLMEIEGKMYEAYVKEKEEAKKVYAEAQSEGQSAGLVEVNSRDSNVFNVNVNIKPETKVTFNLTYEELLNRKLGQYEQSIQISPEQIENVKDFQILVTIEESRNITTLHVPNVRNDLDSQIDSEDENKEAVIVRPAGNKAKITWSPSAKNQVSLAKQGIAGKFTVQYDIDRNSNAGEVLVMEGYFVHFFAPANLSPLRKHVVFVLDISGSMTGRKMEQLRESQKKILDDLSPDDFFNIITFSSDVSSWSPMDEPKNKPFAASPHNIKLAKEFINSLEVDSLTNIHDALMEALNLAQGCKPDLPENAKSLIMFLTDGEPSTGPTTDPAEIQRLIQIANKNSSIPIFSLAFGDGADVPFVRKLSLQNQGFARKIYEASDAVLQLEGFYNEIASPLLSNVKFNYTSPEFKITDLTVAKFPTVFGGSEVVLAGKLVGNVSEVKESQDKVHQQPSNSIEEADRFVQSARPLLSVGITGSGRDGIVDFAAPTFLACRIPWHGEVPSLTPAAPRPQPPSTKEDRFLERLWAYLTIQQLIKKDLAGLDTTNDVDVDDVHTTNAIIDTSKQQALKLALKYGFVTPLTSLVVVKPNMTQVANAVTADVKPEKSSFSAAVPYYGSGFGSASANAAPMSSFSPFAYSNSNAALMSSFSPFAYSNSNAAPFNSFFQFAHANVAPVNQNPTIPPTSSLKLQDIKWLDNGEYSVTINQTSYTIQNDDETTDEGYKCDVNLPTSHAKEAGECRPLKDCVKNAFVNDESLFRNSYFCPLKATNSGVLFVGTCCVG